MSLIGIILGFISLSPNLVNTDTRLAQEQQRFYHLLELLADRAILENQPYAVAIYQQQYRFFRYQPESREWLSLDEDKSLYPRPIPSTFAWQIEQDGQIQRLDTLQPQIIFFPDGEHSAFSAQLQSQNDTEAKALSIKGDGIALQLH